MYAPAARNPIEPTETIVIGKDITAPPSTLPAVRPAPPAVRLTSVDLTRGSDESVRTVLAAKLCRLLPGLSADMRDQVYEVTVRALEALARDQAVRVRAALATAIKDIDCAPPKVCQMLARDVEQSVAEPILRYCVTLTDDDLIEIITGKPPGWALSAIAGRPQVSGAVASAIVDAGDIEATGMLLANRGATVPDDVMTRLVEDSIRNLELQLKLANRPALPKHLGKRLAQFVDDEVLDILAFRHGIDPETAQDITAATRRRADWEDQGKPGEGQMQRAKRLYQERRLDDTVIGDALALDHLDFVRIALALLAPCSPETVVKVLNAQSPKGVTALAWHCGLSMRVAIQIQARAARIPPRRLLNARDGTGYPISETEMLWHLEFFGIDHGR